MPNTHWNSMQQWKMCIRDRDCCGCTACYAICPKDAITMIEDEEGFEYPQIDENKCVHCYQCIKAVSYTHLDVYKRQM